MFRYALLLLALPILSSALTTLDGPVSGAGVWNESYALEANANPNSTSSVPFNINGQDFTFQVNVAEFTPTGKGANITENPRIAASFYNLLWDGKSSLNDTLRSPGTIPKLCVTVAMGPSTVSATNGYREEDDGDCSHALGKQCIKDLANVTSSQMTSCTGQWMPESCRSELGDGGLLSHNLVGPLSTNDTTDPLYQKSPRGFGWYQSELHSAGNMSYYQRENERLHAAFFYGSSGEIVPVCTRVNTTRLSKDSNAVGSGAGSSRGNAYLSAALALAVIALTF